MLGHNRSEMPGVFNPESTKNPAATAEPQVRTHHGIFDVNQKHKHIDRIQVALIHLGLPAALVSGALLGLSKIF